MIRISFDVLKKYEARHVKYLEGHLSQGFPVFPSIYQVTDIQGFIFDLLTNPFKSNILFLKEYFLTVKFIIQTSNYINNKELDLSESVASEQIQLLQKYINELESNSIFSKIIFQKNPQKNSDFKHIIELLQQFISFRKDAHNSKKKKYTQLENDLKAQIQGEYLLYEGVRKFLIKVKRSYKNKVFDDNKIELLEALGVFVCPYCNRQYIDIFKRKKHGTRTAIAELDHFYPKSLFPLYAVSLYNIVPNCAKCNSLKSNTLSDYLYPYCESADDENKKQHFQLQFHSYDQLRGVANRHKPMIRLASTMEKKSLANAEALFHEELYQNHTSFVQRLLRAQRLDNSEYRKSINQYFQDYKLTENDLKEILYGFNGSPEELLEKPLAKLAHDIINFTKSNE